MIDVFWIKATLNQHYHPSEAYFDLLFGGLSEMTNLNRVKDPSKCIVDHGKLLPIFSIKEATRSRLSKRRTTRWQSGQIMNTPAVLYLFHYSK